MPKKDLPKTQAKSVKATQTVDTMAGKKYKGTSATAIGNPMEKTAPTE